jgi:PadR family transcriptional regulator PadR
VRRRAPKPKPRVQERQSCGARSFIGEFEQMVLPAILQIGDRAYALDVRRDLERSTGRAASRSALYRTFDRLADKGYLTWELEDGSPVPDRGGHPMRRLWVTKAGKDALRQSRTALSRLWEGLDAFLGGP